MPAWCGTSEFSHRVATPSCATFDEDAVVGDCSRQRAAQFLVIDVLGRQFVCDLDGRVAAAPLAGTLLPELTTLESRPLPSMSISTLSIRPST